MMGDRARLTIADLVYTLFGVGFLAALHPVLIGGMEANSATIPTGALYLLRLFLPLSLLVMLWVIWRKATTGA